MKRVYQAVFVNTHLVEEFWAGFSLLSQPWGTARKCLFAKFTLSKNDNSCLSKFCEEQTMIFAVILELQAYRSTHAAK